MKGSGVGGRGFVEKRGAVDEAGGVAVVDGHFGAGPEAGAGEAAVFGEAIEANVEIGAALGVLESFEVVGGDDASAGFEGGVLGVFALAERFDDGVGGEVEEVGFAAAGRAGGAELVVEPETGAEDGGVADASGDFEEESGGRGGAAEVAVGVQGGAVDGAMLADVVRTEEGFDEGGELVGRGRDAVVVSALGFFPVEPDLAGLVGEEVGVGEAVHFGESVGAVADEEAMVGALHDEAGDGGGVEDVAEGGDGAAGVGGAVHDGGVEFDDAVFVGDAAETDGVVGGVGLDNGDAGDGGVEWIGAVLKLTHGFLDAA